MDAYNSEESSSAREWLVRIGRTLAASDLFDALDSALFNLELYETERDLAGQLSFERSRLFGESSQTDAGSLNTLLAENRRNLFSALARQINAQENLRIAVEQCRETFAAASAPFEAEMFLAWIESQAESAREEVQMHQLLIDHDRS